MPPRPLRRSSIDSKEIGEARRMALVARNAATGTEANIRRLENDLAKARADMQALSTKVNEIDERTKSEPQGS